jgi:DNA-binding winged helix-turn-helix (wHTH) protein
VFPPFRLDAPDQCLWRGTEQIALSPKAFSVLLFLVERPGRLVTKQELLDAVWPDIHVTEGVLKRAVLEIRKALGDEVEEPRFIQTMHRRGYRFLAAASQKQTTPAAAKVADAAVEPGIVGRSQEFQQLDGWLENALQSSRQVVFISGEAGIGKSTLVEAWMRTLRQRGMALARGRCLQQFGSGEPYLPIFEALEELSHTLGQRLVENLRLRAPTWLLHMPALISLQDRVKLRDEVFGSTRERMLREITDALESLSNETPLVIALEDLHWSDPSTIDLLSSVARRTSPARLMILATYRPGDAATDADRGAGPLSAVQNELELHRQCKVLRLNYLSEEATGGYLSARFPEMGSAPLETGLAAALHRRTNGNPLYVVCLVDELERSRKVGGDPDAIREMVPETLQQMFERQAAHLNAREKEMLDSAAVAGESFSVAGIGVATGLDSAEVETLCEALVRRHVVLKRGETVRFPDGAESPGYSFVHALCRDALYRQIPPGRRSRLHSQFGRAEEQLYASDPKRVAGQLAGHFELAGDPARTVRYLRLAAEGAAERCSTTEAAQYLERAFGIAERLTTADRASLQMDLLEQRVMMRLTASDMPGAAADLRSLAIQARQEGATNRETRALLESLVPLSFVDYRQSLAAIDQAQAAQAASPDPVLGAAIDMCRGFSQMYWFGWNRESAKLMDAAVPKLRTASDLRIRTRACWMESAALTFASEYAAACESAERSRQYARKAGAFFDYFVASMYLHWALLHRGDLGRAIQVARDGAELAARNASRMPLLWFTVREAWVRMEAGDFATALAAYERNVESAAALAVRPTSFQMYLWLGVARLGHGDPEGAWQALEILREVIESGGGVFQMKCPLLHAQAKCEWKRGNIDHARELAERLVEVATEHRERSYAARGFRLLAEVATDEGSFQSAAESIARAEAALEGCEAWTVEWQVYATAAKVLRALKRFDESDRYRERSRRAADRVLATLEAEPDLHRSLLGRVEADLLARSSTA